MSIITFNVTFHVKLAPVSNEMLHFICVCWIFLPHWGKFFPKNEESKPIILNCKKGGDLVKEAKNLQDASCVF